jgi:hypothetical protein
MQQIDGFIVRDLQEIIELPALCLPRLFVQRNIPGRIYPDGTLSFFLFGRENTLIQQYGFRENELSEPILRSGENNYQVDDIRSVERRDRSLLTAFPQGDELPCFGRGDLCFAEADGLPADAKRAGSIFPAFGFAFHVCTGESARFIHLFHGKEQRFGQCGCGLPGHRLGIKLVEFVVLFSCKTNGFITPDPSLVIFSSLLGGRKCLLYFSKTFLTIIHMKLTHVTAAAVCIGMMLVACQKDKEISGVQTNKQLRAGDPEQGEDIMAAFFAQTREHATEHFKIRADKGGVIVTEQGTELHIQPGVLMNPDGSQIEGWVEVAVLDNYSRGADALTNLTTETDGAEDNPGLLTSAGSFDFDFTTEQGGEVINPEGGVEVHVPAENMGADADGNPNPDMKIWVGEESDDQDRDNTWQENGETPVIVGDEYQFQIAAPWYPINLDVRLDWNAPMIPLTVDLPSQFNENNAEVYVTFDGYPGMIASMDVYDMTNAWWGEHYGMVNVGVPIHVIAVGVVGGQLYAELKSVTTSINSPSGGDHEVLTNLTATDPITLQADIDALP